MFALCALVIGQPVLDSLDHNPGYLLLMGLTPLDIAIVAAVTLVGPPLVLLAVELMARFFGTESRRRVHTALIGLLFALVLTAALDRPLSPLKAHGIPGGGSRC